MSMLRVLAMMGGAAGGYTEGQAEARKQALADEDAAFRREQRDRQRTDWKRADLTFAEQQADKESIRAATAPVQSTPVYPTGDDEGNVMPMTPDMQRFTVPGQAGVLEGKAATQTVEALNDPAARMQRAAAAVRDPELALKLGAGAVAAQSSALQLDGLKREQLERQWKRKIGDAFVHGSWDEGAKFLSHSKADGMGGQSQWTVKFSDDQKVATLHPMGPNGETLPSELRFPNSPVGRMTAAMWFDGKTDFDRKLADLRADEKARFDRDDKIADNQRQDKVANSMISLQTAQTAQIKAAGARAETAESAFDFKGARQLARDNVLAVNKANVEAGKPPMSPKEIAQQVDAVVNENWTLHRDRFALRTVQRELLAAQGQPGAYASIYAKAAKVLPASVLLANGFDLPNEAGDKPALVDRLKIRDAATPAGAQKEGKSFMGDLVEKLRPSGASTASGAGAKPPQQTTPPRLDGPLPFTDGNDGAQGAALDSARAATAAAHQRLMAFGSVQRAKDPAGFAAAQAAYRSAKATSDEAEQAYRQAVSRSMPSGAAMRYSSP